MFANGSCLPERSARRRATVTSSVPLAMSASRINSFDANFPVPTSRRDANSRSAILSFEGLSAMGKDKRIHEHARMSGDTGYTVVVGDACMVLGFAADTAAATGVAFASERGLLLSACTKPVTTQDFECDEL